MADQRIYGINDIARPASSLSTPQSAQFLLFCLGASPCCRWRRVDAAFAMGPGIRALRENPIRAMSSASTPGATR